MPFTPSPARFLLVPGLLTAVTLLAQDTAPAAADETGAPSSATSPASVSTPPPTTTPEGVVRLTSTFAYIEGDFGLATDTTVLAALFGAEYDTARWRVRGTVPVISVDGPASVGTAGAVGARPTTSTETGLGDLTFEGTWKFLPATSRHGVDLTGRVKAPTADEDKGLGTGNTDYYVQADYRYTLPRGVLFANLGWQFLGDSSAYELEDGPYATLGYAAPLNDKTTAGGALTWRDATTSGGDDSVEAMLFASRNLTPDWRLTGFVLTGFTDASPDFGAGLGAAYAF